MALFKKETSEEVQARVDKHNAAGDAQRAIMHPEDNPDTTDLESLTRAGAIAEGNYCLARAKMVLEESDDKKVYSRINVTGIRLESAVYWNTRAQALYALGALLD